MRKWEVLSSERLIDDRWITVRSDRCRRDDGLVIEPYYVLERPDWVCILALTPDLNVILTREYRHGAGVIGVGFPSGSAERSDADAMDAAKRELLEETGYACRSLELLGATYANWANHNNLIHFYFGLGAEKVGSARPDPTEEIEVMLLPLAEFLRDPGLKQSYHLACLQLAQPHLARIAARPR